jgi:methanogenic corrinoid protein MtbC1
MNNQLFEDMAKSVINGEVDEAKQLAQQAIEQLILVLSPVLTTSESNLVLVKCFCQN